MYVVNNSNLIPFAEKLLLYYLVDDFSTISIFFFWYNLKVPVNWHELKSYVNIITILSCNN